MEWRLWISSIASAILAARHVEGGNRNNYHHSARARNARYSDRYRDPRHRRPLPEAEQKRGEEGREKAEKKSKREIKAAATDSCEQRVFPRRAVTHLPLFASYNMDASNTR